jgi:hypothetical protein
LIPSDQKACVIFNKLIVTNIEDTSGIFIGTNQAIGWSSYSKSNQGFGSLTDATLSNSISVVRDPDLIDASVHDARFISLAETGNAAQQCVIDFQSVNVNTVVNNSAVDLGDIKQLGWRSARKVNYGEGKIFGHNRTSQTVSIVFDEDAVDASFQTQENTQDQLGKTEKNVRIKQKNQNSEGESL